jgi:hypothetical protein
VSQRLYGRSDVPVRFARKSRLISDRTETGGRLALASLFLLLGCSSLQNASANGDTRTLSFQHTHRDDSITVTFKRNGRYDDEGLKKLNHFLRDWRTDETTKMDPHLFDILWEVHREVGGQEPIRIDVRVLAATNRDLEETVREGSFRADLFYRLNVLPLRMPALRERRSDIPQLTMFFLARFARKLGKKVEGVSQETIDLLVNYPWPGNIRELQNIIERGVALSESPILTLSRNLFPASAFSEGGAGLAAQASATAPGAISPSATTIATSTPASETPLSLEEIERRHILSVLEQTRWVIEGPQGAAKVLNLHPNTLRGRLKKLGIQRPGAHLT